MLLAFTFLGSDIVKSFYSICLAIDMIIYKLISGALSVFTILSDTRIFTDSQIANFSNRVYLIISVVMLFVLAYSFLTVIINPDNMLKGKVTPGKMVINVVVSISVVLFVPTIFDYAYKIQDAIVKNNVVGKLVLGSQSSVNVGQMSGEFTTIIFESSYYLKDDASQYAIAAYQQADMESRANGNIGAFANETFDYVQSEDIEYNFIICGIIGIFVLYVLVTFCIDLGVRVIKLAFLQLFAPVPALLYMIPNGQKSLNSWIKETLQVFVEVFVRIGVLYFTVFAVSVVNKSFDSGELFGFIAIEGFFLKNLCRLFLILGILLFCKQAPGLISQILGIKMDGGMFDLKRRINDIKEVTKPITAVPKSFVKGGAHLIDRVGGTAGGIMAARMAYQRGINAGNKGSLIKSSLATLHGIRNGFNGGIRNVGAAYNYEMETQRSYALDKDKSVGTQIRNASFDMLRDNLGFQTRYEDEKREIQIKRDNKLAPYRQNIKNIEEKTATLRSKIEDGHRVTFNDNKSVNEAAVKLDDDLTSECLKEDNKIFSSYREMMDSKSVDLKKDLETIDNNMKTATGDELIKLQNEKQRIEKEQNYITIAEEIFNKEKRDIKAELNNYGIQKLIDNVDLNDGDRYNEAQQTALRYLFKSAQDINKVKYLESDFVTSKIDLDLQNLKLAANKQNAGKIKKAIYDANGVLVDYEYDQSNEKDFKAFLNDTKKLLKLKKESGILMDTESKFKNDEMSTAKETVIIDGKSISRSLYELNDILTDQKDYVQKVDKEVERMLEAYKDQEDIQKIIKSRNDSAPKYKRRQK